jgi:hypothetical protein
MVVARRAPRLISSETQQPAAADSIRLPAVSPLSFVPQKFVDRGFVSASGFSA